MSRIRLVHWKASEAKEKAAKLEEHGHKVDCAVVDQKALRAMRNEPPDAVIIDLNRMPSQGRDVAVALRTYKSTRNVPLLFVEGDPHKTVRIQELLPDAVYTTWDKIHADLQQAIANPPTDPLVPESVFAGYAGKSLPEKLGIKASSVVALIDAPEDLETTLGDLPAGVTLVREKDRPCSLTIWFTKSRQELKDGIQQMAALNDNESLWITWPKKSSKMTSDLSQVIVRRTAEAAGLVDYKIISVDKTWSGLLFTKKKVE